MSKVYLIGEVSFIKEFKTYEEAKRQADIFSIEDFGNNSSQEYRILREEDLREEAIQKSGLAKSDDGQLIGTETQWNKYNNYLKTFNLE